MSVKVASCWDTVPSTGALTLLTRSSVIPRSRKPDGEAKKIQNTSKIKLQKGKVVKLSIKSRNKKKKKQAMLDVEVNMHWCAQAPRTLYRSS